LGVLTSPAFILTTESSLNHYDRETNQISQSLIREYSEALLDLERQTGKVFGAVNGSPPLILCVRAGAPVHQLDLGNDEIREFDFLFSEKLGMRCASESLTFPGIQESVLGIGFNDEVCQNLATFTSARFAWNSFANFILRFGIAVLNVPPTAYYKCLCDVIIQTGRTHSELSTEDLKLLVTEFQIIQLIPSDVHEQLRLSICAAYATWFQEKSRRIRNEIMEIPSKSQGVALCVQAMVFGGGGSCVSRCPISGDNIIVGEFWPAPSGLRQSYSELNFSRPDVALELKKILGTLESHFRDIQVKFNTIPI
jgi:hypothetical protein